MTLDDCAASLWDTLICQDSERRQQVIDQVGLNGIDYIEVPAATLDAQRFVRVYFLKTDMVSTLDGQPGRFRVDGGVRVTNLRVQSATQSGSKCIIVEVDRAGDFSIYTLTVDAPWVDPMFACRQFSFKAGCPSDFDCRQEQICPAETGPTPLIDYLAKDYSSFRQALLDLIPTLAPDWTERNPADLGIALVELLAYAGDQLSYYQDAVANEAYLETARQRISVRRHARLVDYQMHDGASARAFVQVQCSAAGTIPAGTSVLTRLAQPIGATIPGAVIAPELGGQALAAATAVFETMHPAAVHPDLNTITLYAWGDKECCLPRGATELVLQGDLTALLKAGGYLLLEERTSPVTGEEADANPAYRQVVRLTNVTPDNDPLRGQPLTRVCWDQADKLTFPLCLSAVTTREVHPYEPAVSVARGNLILADHGRSHTDEEYRLPDAPPNECQRRAHRFLLDRGPLSFRVPPPAGSEASLWGNGTQSPAIRLFETDPRKALPQVTRLAVSGTSPADDWQPVLHLLDSDDFAHHVAVETDNDGRPLLRFGDNEYGAAPPDKANVRVDYRVGVGSAGNVGAEALSHLIRPAAALAWPDVTAVRNPLPAWGGIDPEPIEQAKQLAPAAFHAEQLRAVTEADYARAAGKHPDVSKAVATFRWTGSWHTVFITVDPVGRADLPAALQERIKAWVRRFTQAGYDLEIDPPTYVSLEIEIDVCVAPTHFRAHVQQAVLKALSNRPGGFFHPDQWTFGQSVYLSKLYAAVEAVEGVDSAEVKLFQRFGKAANSELDQGYIPLGRLEVARLDNDPNFQEHGVLRLNMLGGK